MLNYCVMSIIHINSGRDKNILLTNELMLHIKLLLLE